MLNICDIVTCCFCSFIKCKIYKTSALERIYCICILKQMQCCGFKSSRHNGVRSTGRGSAGWVRTTTTYSGWRRGPRTRRSRRPTGTYCRTSSKYSIDFYVWNKRNIWIFRFETSDPIYFIFSLYLFFSLFYAYIICNTFAVF